MITMELINEQRVIAIRQIQGGQTGNQVAQHFAVDCKTIRPLDWFAQTVHVKDRPCSGWSRVTI